MAVNIHITIIELNALHTKRQNLFQELDAVIHLLMEAKHWGLRKSRNATSLNSRFKSLDTLKVKIISVTFRRVIRTNHKDRKSGSAFLLNRSSDLYGSFLLPFKIISVTFRRVIRTNHKKASKIWRHENIQLGGRSEERRVGKECRCRWAAYQ